MRSRIWITLHALVALVPVVGMLLHAPDALLFGVEAEGAAPFPSIGYAEWRDEKLQPTFQTWFEAHIGFRGAMVRTDNTVQQFVFDQTKPGSDTVIGKKGVLFFRDDLTYAGTRSDDLPAALSQVDRLTRGIGSVHQKLTARGKHLVVIISPSKTGLYPEAEPAPWIRGSKSHFDVDLHDALRAGLQRSGVPFADARAILSATPTRDREITFPRDARHWSAFGACQVLREALRPDVVVPSCDYDMIRHPREAHVDFDLYRLLNRWHPADAAWAEVPVVRPAVRSPRPGSPRLRTVIVGTSFMWMFADLLRPLVDLPVIALFYNKTAFELGEVHRRLGPVDPSTPEWVDWVLDRDLYILDVLETYADRPQMIEFVETLDQRLD